MRIFILMILLSLSVGCSTVNKVQIEGLNGLRTDGSEGRSRTVKVKGLNGLRTDGTIEDGRMRKQKIEGLEAGTRLP